MKYCTKRETAEEGDTMKSKMALVISVWLFVLCSACAQFQLNPRSEDALSKRVQTLWEAKTRNDWAAVYDMTVESYRMKVDKDAFIQAPKAATHSFVIKEIELVESGGKAVVTVESKIDVMGRQFPMTIKDQWVWEKGAWCLKLSPTTFQDLFKEKPGEKPPP
jgi:hypothetical protein